MIENENHYKAYLETKNVGAKDIVADSIRSYISYLNSVSRHLNITITKDTLKSDLDIENIVNRLEGKVAKQTIRNYSSAMRHYVNMVND